jgi:hypothetical protein
MQPGGVRVLYALKPCEPGLALLPRREVFQDRPTQCDVCGADQCSLVHVRKDHPARRQCHC